MKATGPARCVLMFHRIVDVHERDHDVSWQSLMRVLDGIDGHVTTELELTPESGSGIVLTFDDGSADHAAVGDALAQRNLPGIFFVPAGMLGTRGFLADSQLRELHTSGHVVGSHGFLNIRLDGLSSRQSKNEVHASKERLQDILGTPVRLFAPPGGSEHPSLVPELEKGGFHGSRSVRWGIYRSKAERWRIPCIPVTEMTIARGWVQQALSESRLPWTMRAIWSAKELLPMGVRASVRARRHRAWRE